MPSSLLLVVLLLGPEPSGATQQALQEAALEVLGEDANLRIQHVEPLDEEVVRKRLSPAPGGLVTVRWHAGAGQVELHSYLETERRWVERQIVFEPDEPKLSRGRLVGMVAATLLLQPVTPKPELRGPAEDLPVIPVKRSASVLEDKVEEQSAATGSSVGRADRGGGKRLDSESTRSRWILEFLGTGMVGIGGEAEMFGAAGGLRLPLSRASWLRLGISGRTGEIDGADASADAVQGSVGLMLELLPISRFFQTSLRVAALGGWFRVAQLGDSGAQRQTLGRPIWGGEAALVGALRLGNSSAFQLAAGTELLTGRTEIFSGDDRLATVPALRVVFELGLQTELNL